MRIDIEGGGHGWPQGGRKSVAATELIWAFFVAHPRRAAEDAAEGEPKPKEKAKRSRRDR